ALVAHEAQPGVVADLLALVPAAVAAAPAGLGRGQPQRAAAGAGQRDGPGRRHREPGDVVEAAVDVGQRPEEPLGEPGGPDRLLPPAVHAADPEGGQLAGEVAGRDPHGPGSDGPALLVADRDVEGGRVAPDVEAEAVVQLL